MNNNKYLQKVEDRILLNLAKDVIKFALEKSPTREELRGVYDFLVYLDEEHMK